MSAIIFAGPSIYGIDRGLFSGLRFCPPAASGDLLRAVEGGGRLIGLIDGLYGDCAAVWHKEILFALSQGVTVLGAASMGALRAAECETYGMVGLGDVFRAYRDGLRTSDADVAVSHAPGEMDYRPLTIPLVDAEATIDRISPELEQGEARRLLQGARQVHFSVRTWREIARTAGFGHRMGERLRESAVSAKQQDALLLLDAARSRDIPNGTMRAWTFQTTVFFQGLQRRNKQAGQA